ncbi:HAD hydrolase-like protein [Candidatus Roizmanbacteria bacterium]|nr:HAD hydrolase-like protein [Candidatus Roizmanbacteria bacterium]
MIKKDYRVILFDLDGVLTDPKEGITKSIQYALSKMHIIENNLDSLAKFIGPPLFHTFNTHYKFSEKKSWEAVKYYQERFSIKGLYENRVYDGVSELLNKLKVSGRKILLVSSKPAVYCYKIIEHFLLDKYFNKVVGPGLDLKNADKTNLILQAINYLPEYEKEEFVMVGDRMHDIVGANNNKINSIGVTYGFGSIQELKACKPTYIINSISDLKSLLL